MPHEIKQHISIALDAAGEPPLSRHACLPLQYTSWRVTTEADDHAASCVSKARCLGGDWSAGRVSWVAGLRRWQGHAQRTLLLEKGENVAMHVGIVRAHNHMPVALFPEQLLVRGLELGIDKLRAFRAGGSPRAWMSKTGRVTCGNTS